MVEAVTNFSQVVPADDGDWTAAAVAGADAAMPFVTSGSTSNGIDNAVKPQQLSNQGTALVLNNFYSAWSGDFPASASYDMSAVDAQMSIHLVNLSPGYTAIAQNSSGIRIALFSGGGTTNWGRWHFPTDTGFVSGGWRVFTLQGTPDATGGTFDNTDVTGIGVMFQSGGAGFAFGFQLAADQVVHSNGPIIWGDSGAVTATTPDDFYDLLEPESGQSYHSLLFKKAASTIELGVPVRIEAANYQNSLQAFGLGFSGADGVGYPAMPSGFYQFIAAPASGTQVYENGSITASGQSYDLTLDGSSGSITTDTCIFAGVNDSDLSGSSLTINNSSIAAPATCSIADFTANGLTITDSVADIQWTADLGANSAWSTNSDIDITFGETDLSDIALSLTASNTITLSPVASINPYDLSGLTTTDTVTFDNATAVDTTVTLQSGTSNAVVNPSAGGGAIAVDSPTSTFTINTNTPAYIRIFTAGTQTLLGSASAATTLAFAHTGQTVDYEVGADGYYWQRFTSETLSGSTPTTVNLVAEPFYNASHTLTYTTDASHSRANNELSVPAYGPSGQDVWSLMSEAWGTETALYNTEFPYQLNGAGSLFLRNGCEGASDTDTENLTECGSRYVSAAGATTAEWIGMLSNGEMTGFQSEYQTTPGSGTTDTRATGIVNQLLKVYGDAAHGNFDNRSTSPIVKAQPNGYLESRAEVFTGSASPQLYNFGLAPQLVDGLTVGDPGITGVTITNHGATPVSWDAGNGARDYSITITDSNSNSGSDIHRWLSYNLSLDATFQGEDPFNYPPMVISAGGSLETLRGIIEGSTGATLKGVRVIRTGDIPHPDFARFNADNGTYGEALTNTGLAFSGLVAGSQIVVCDTGTQTERYRNNSSGASETWSELYSSDGAVDYTIMRVGYVPIRVTGVAIGNSVVGIQVQQQQARAYEASSGLTYGTTATVNTGTGRFGLTVASTVQNYYSFWNEEWIAQASLVNIQFPIDTFGESTYIFNDYEFDGTSSIDNLSRDGFEFYASSVLTAAYAAFLSTANGDVSTFQAERQVNGTTTDLPSAGGIDRVLQIYGDASHGNFDNRSSDWVFKMQPNGYIESRSSLFEIYGISQLVAGLYIFALDPQVIPGFTIGDPVISVTLVDHTAAPITVGGETFSWELQDNGANSAEAMLRDLNFYKSGDTTSADYLNLDPFNLPEWIRVSGGTYSTVTGRVEGESVAHGLWVSRGGSDHPGFSSFAADNGNPYEPDTVAQIDAPNLTAGQIQIVNETGRTASAWTATTVQSLYSKVLRTTGAGSEQNIGLYFQCTTGGTTGGTEPTWDTTLGNTTTDGSVIWTCRAIEFDNSATTSGYNNSWTDHEDFDNGDTIRLRWVDDDDAEISATGIATSEGTTSFLNTPIADTVYNTYAIDGTTVTEYSADFPNVQVDINDPDNVFYIARLYAWWKSNLNTADGLRYFFGGLTAQDASNIIIENDVVDLFLDNVKTVSARQGDAITIRRRDGVYPQASPTSGGGGLGFYYTGVGYTAETGVSGLTSEESTVVLSDVPAIKAKTDQLEFTVANRVDSSAINTADIRTEMDSNSVRLAAIEADTNELQSDDIPGLIAALNNLDGGQIADSVLIRNLAGGSDGGRTIQDALRGSRNRVVIDDVGGTITVYQEDDTTIAWQGPITTRSGDAIGEVNPL